MIFIKLYHFSINKSTFTHIYKITNLKLGITFSAKQTSTVR